MLWTAGLRWTAADGIELWRFFSRASLEKQSLTVDFGRFQVVRRVRIIALRDSLTRNS